MCTKQLSLTPPSKIREDYYHSVTKYASAAPVEDLDTIVQFLSV